MSLVKKAAMTQRKLDANRANAISSHGPSTPEGKERIRAANTRHGQYSDRQQAALRALGEDPAEFEELLAGVREEFSPSSRLQEELAARLARALQLMQRADRAQEGVVLARAQGVEAGRDNRLHARMMRLKMGAQTLRSLARSVNVWHYVATLEELGAVMQLFEKSEEDEIGQVILDLFNQLQEPGTEDDTTEQKKLQMVASIRSMFGLPSLQSPVQALPPAEVAMGGQAESPEAPEMPPDGDDERDSHLDDRYPQITEDDWVAREKARKLLRNLLTRHAESWEEQRKALLRESLAGASPCEVAAECAPISRDSLIARRLQESNLREVRRLTSLLLKLKKRRD